MIDTACQTTPIETTKHTAVVTHKLQVCNNFADFKRTCYRFINEQ